MLILINLLNCIDFSYCTEYILIRVDGLPFAHGGGTTAIRQHAEINKKHLKALSYFKLPNFRFHVIFGYYFLNEVKKCLDFV